jgi:hypothetical protein
MACAPKLTGPTASAGYFFTVLYPNTILLRADSEIVVKVQNAAGQPVDGIPVLFEVDASWSGDATISPARVATHKGRASAFIDAGILGILPVWITVDGTTQEIRITTDQRGSGPSGGA